MFDIWSTKTNNKYVQHDGLNCLVECKIFQLPPCILKHITFTQFCFFLLDSVFSRLTSHRLNYLRRLYTLTTEWWEWWHLLAPAQRWHLAGSTGTRLGPVQLNASEALHCFGSRTPSSTRPAGVVWVAGPEWYERDAERSHGTCNRHGIAVIKYENYFLFSM
jgi:hypothetical protein